MKTTLVRLFTLLLVFTVAAQAAENEQIAAVRAADDERQAATKLADPKRMDAIFADELRYAHSSGKVDDKAAYVKSLTSHSIVYQTFDYKERTFTPVAPGVVLMVGRAVITSVNDGVKVENDLNYLAVWREEKGRWRFFAWQSCKNPPGMPGGK